MAVHFIHIGKTGGTAIKHAVRSANARQTPRGPLYLHRHWYTLRDLREDHFTLFCVRDPVSRFVSAFESRQRKGQPRYYYEWTDKEERAFARFASAEELARALGSDRRNERAPAEQAMRGIRHVRQGLERWLVGPEYLEQRRHQILYIARQESLNQDWERLKLAIGLPPDLRLPGDSVAAHRSAAVRPPLGEQERRNLQRWYRRDYEILEWCEAVRRENQWAHSAGAGCASDEAGVRPARG